MSHSYLYSLVSVLIVSLISLVGIVALSIKIKDLKNLLLFLVSFSVGTLLGDVFIHLLPELVAKQGFTLTTSLQILFGLLLFFVLEKVVYWRHCHLVTCDDHPHTLGTMNLIGDALHNFLDGAMISASYLFSIPLGLATTLAIIFHEIPQEIGDFSVLLYAGFTKSKALRYNFFSALFAIVGAILVLLIGQQYRSMTNFLIPLGIGGFLYIAGSDLIPELKKEENLGQTFFQLLAIIGGIFIMWLLKQ